MSKYLQLLSHIYCHNDDAIICYSLFIWALIIHDDFAMIVTRQLTLLRPEGKDNRALHLLCLRKEMITQLRNQLSDAKPSFEFR